MFAAEYATATYSCCITSTQMNATKYAAKTANMKHQISCTHYQFRWTESRTTSSASSWWKQSTEMRQTKNEEREKKLYMNKNKVKQKY